LHPFLAVASTLLSHKAVIRGSFSCDPCAETLREPHGSEGRPK
jgi:hypothetical protein